MSPFSPSSPSLQKWLKWLKDGAIYITPWLTSVASLVSAAGVIIIGCQIDKLKTEHEDLNESIVNDISTLKEEQTDIKMSIKRKPDTEKLVKGYNEMITILESTPEDQDAGVEQGSENAGAEE